MNVGIHVGLFFVIWADSSGKLLLQNEDIKLELSYLPSHSETNPTQKEDSMPPMEKMATDSDQREVRVPVGMDSPYR